MKKFFAMLLTLILCMSAFPLSVLATSYVPNYITSIGIAYSGTESKAKNLVTGNGFTLLDYDLNKGTGSDTDYIYMGYKTSNDPSNAITGIIFRESDKKDHPDSLSYGGATFYLLGGSVETNGTGDGAVDLNYDAGGKYIYTYITRDTNYNGGYPLIPLWIMSKDTYATNIGINAAVNNSGAKQNLNAGTKGDAVYLHYRTFEYIKDEYLTDSNKDVNSSTAYLGYAYRNANGSEAVRNFSAKVKHHQYKHCPQFNPPQTVSLDGYTFTFAGWQTSATAYDPIDETPYVTYMADTQDGHNRKYYYAVYSGTVTLSYDANGGSGAPNPQTNTLKMKARLHGNQYISGNGDFRISSDTPTNGNKCSFLGWSTDKNTTTAQYSPGQSVTFKSNTTLYAVWGDHTYSNQWTSDGTSHWHASTCGHNLRKDEAAHSGGTATCAAQAVCTVCKKSYGFLGGHSYGSLISAKEAVHEPNKLEASVAAHYYCSVCKKYFDKNKNETTLAKLTGATPQHSFGNWVNTDPDKHWKACTCGLKSEEGAHVYDNDQDTTCNTCGYVRTVHNHSFAPNLSYDANNHWYAATCGHDVTSGLEPHHGGTANCTSQAATFSVETTGDGLNYQWYIKHSDASGWKKLEGAIGATYITAETDLDCDGFQYGCRIGDQHGNTLQSDVAVLHVSALPELPETGDSATSMLWLAMSILSLAGILLLRRKAYRK